MEYIVGAVSVIAATIIVFVYLVFVWWLDRYEREPFWLVLIAFAFGGIFGTSFACSISSVPAAIAVLLFGAEAGATAAAVFVAPVVEELTKALVFVGLVLSKHFDNETDGLIYGAATGLGFACVENLMYFAGAENVEQLVGMAVLRTLFTAVVHATSSATLGMAIGYARRRGLGRGFIAIGLGYVLAVLNHGTWNALASGAGFESMQESGLSPVLMLVGCGLVVSAGFVLFMLTQLSLKREHDVIRRFLALEAQAGVLPMAHVEVIPYWLKRRKSGWLEPNIPKDKYIEAATLLAFRRHQLQDAGGTRRQKLQEDIERYRAELVGFRVAA